MNNGTRVQSSPTSSLEVRDRLVEALELDLVGPGAGHRLATEMLPGWIRPSNWYPHRIPHPVRGAGGAALRP